MLEDVIKRYGGVEVTAMDVYRDMFSLGDNLIQGREEPAGEFKTNPVGYFKNNDAAHGNFRILFEDTFEEDLKCLQDADFGVLTGATYFGRKYTSENASKLYALIFDLDDIDDSRLGNFFSGAFRGDVYPIPNYVALSGHGVHLYYFLEYGVPLYPNIKLQLKEFKYALTERIWNKYTSYSKKKQMQGIFQPFRVIGGKTKIEGVRVRAFKMNAHPFNLEQLGKYIPEDKRVDETKLWRESKLTLAQAKKKYPEWYQKRIVEGKARDKWTVNENLYNWWLRKISSEATVGHRYFCLMCLAIYAAKCDVPEDQLHADALALIPHFTALDEKNPFTVNDVISALECYDIKYKTFPRSDIARLTAIDIPKNKRNGRKRCQHVNMMNLIRDEINGNTDWRNTEGRPSKEQLVRAYVAAHPNDTPTEITRALGISRTTVYKYLKGENR